MGAKKSGDWLKILKENPELLRVELLVDPEPKPYGTLRLSIEDREPLEFELLPSKVRVLLILQEAYERSRVPPGPDSARGKIDRTRMAAEYRKMAGILIGIKPETMTSYMGAIQRVLRKFLGVPKEEEFPDLIFVRENNPGQRNGARMRYPGITVIRCDE